MTPSVGRCPDWTMATEDAEAVLRPMSSVWVYIIVLYVMIEMTNDSEYGFSN